MVICGRTCGSNVISIMFLTIIFTKLMCGLTCIFEVFINVCSASNSIMVIQVNGVFELLKVNTSMEPNDCMNIC
jgi:hypothetical protein